MLYSAESLKIADVMTWRFGRALKDDALALAKQEGRSLVTEDDIWRALDRISLSDVYEDPDEPGESGGEGT